jgi:hypothetical protein
MWCASVPPPRPPHPPIHTRPGGCCCSRQPPLQYLTRALFCPPPKHAQTADILQAVMAAALKKRLRGHESVETGASCDAWGLAEGEC